MKQIYLLWAVLLLLAGCGTTTPSVLVHKVPVQCAYYSLLSAECITETEYIERIIPYKVIFIGDYHDSAKAHKVVLDTINGLSSKGFKVALANEWFSPQENRLLAAYAAGELDSNSSEALGWKKRVGYDFNLSEPIYKAVIREGGRLYGINMDKKFKKLISDANVSGMRPREKAFYKALDLNVSAHRQMLAPFFGHCHKTRSGETPQQCMERMYRVQVAWDTMMGEESAKLASQLNDDERLIVFVGAMHLESKLGVNLRFARKSRLPFLTVLPYPKEGMKKAEVAQGSADIVYLYDMSKED